MDYKIKYLKYKKKYLNLLKGGYILDDESKDYYFKKIISDHQDKFLTPYNNLFIESYPNPNNKLDLFSMKSPEYIKVYINLIQKYLDSNTYTQKFINQEGDIISEIEDVYPSHINFAALIFLSYLLELELFIITNYNHGYNYYNNENKSEIIYNSKCKSTFCASSSRTCSLYRIYKNKLKNNINNLLDDFTKNLDNLFIECMWSIITKINKFFNPNLKDRQAKVRDSGILFELYKLFVPIKHISYVKGSLNFKYIYVNWKLKVIDFIKSNFINYPNIKKSINAIIKAAIIKFQHKDTQYIAEGTGFFSFIFLSFPELQKLSVGKNINFGSCITYTLLEMYIMSRLHINPNNINLILESADNKPHNIWTYVQNSLNLKSVTHWVSEYKFSTGNIMFRSVFKPHVKKYNFGNLDDKKNIFRALIYPNLDSYSDFVNRFCKYEHKFHILEFIKQRYELFESLLIKPIDNWYNEDYLTKFKYGLDNNNLNIVKKNLSKNLEILLKIKHQMKMPTIQIVNNLNLYKLFNLSNIIEFETKDYNFIYKSNIYSKEVFNEINDKITYPDENLKLNNKIKGIIINIPHNKLEEAVSEEKLKEIKSYNIDQYTSDIDTKEVEKCENIKNKLIRKRKNSPQYQNSKSKCMSCNFKIKSRGKGKFLCSESDTDTSDADKMSLLVISHNYVKPLILKELTLHFGKLVYDLNSKNEEKLEIEGPLTDFVIGKLLRNELDRSRFLELIISIFNKSIENWIREYVLKKYNIESYYYNYQNLKDKIKFIYKGGFSLRMIYKELIRQFSIEVENLIENNFDKYFKLSDFDFEIIIDLPMEGQEYKEIASQLSILSNHVLELLTGLFNTEEYKNSIFTFFNLDIEEQKKHIKILYSKINYIINKNKHITKSNNSLVNGIKQVNGILLTNQLNYSEFGTIEYSKYEPYNLYDHKASNYSTNIALNRYNLPYQSNSPNYNKFDKTNLNVIFNSKSINFENLLSSIKNPNDINYLDWNKPLIDLFDRIIIKKNEILKLTKIIRDNQIFLPNLYQVIISNDSLYISINKISLEELENYRKLLMGRVSPINLSKIFKYLVYYKRYSTEMNKKNIEEKRNNIISNSNYETKNKGIFYTSFNNNLKFGNRIIILARIKVNFRLFVKLKTSKGWIEDSKYLKCMNLGGEVVDVSIKYNDWKKKLFNSKSYSKYKYEDKNKNFEYWSYSLSGQFMDLLVTLYKESKKSNIGDFVKPWENSKYNKRVGRLIFILFLESFNNNEKLDKFRINLEKIKVILIIENKDKHIQQISDMIKSLLKKTLSYQDELSHYLEIENNKLALFLTFHLNFLLFFNDKIKYNNMGSWDNGEYSKYCSNINNELSNILKIINQIQLDNKRESKFTSINNISNIGFIN